MSKHTPGNWKTETWQQFIDGQESQIAAVTADGDGCTYYICKCMGLSFDSEMQVWVATESASANARLIAAAPDLLEACKMIVSNAEDDPDSKIEPYLVMAARDAIAKAEGGEQ